MSEVSHIPTNISVDTKKDEVRITWKDNHQSTFSFDLLRNQCPCALCDEERRKAEEEPLFLRPHITGELLPERPAELVGQYAIQFFWKDGHNAGIYSFDYLRKLDEGEVE